MAPLTTSPAKRSAAAPPIGSTSGSEGAKDPKKARPEAIPIEVDSQRPDYAGASSGKRVDRPGHSDVSIDHHKTSDRLEGAVPSLHIASCERQGKVTQRRVNKLGRQVQTNKVFKGGHIIPRVNSAMSCGAMTISLKTDRQAGIVDGKDKHRRDAHLILTVESLQALSFTCMFVSNCDICKYCKCHQRVFTFATCVVRTNL